MLPGALGDDVDRHLVRHAILVITPTDQGVIDVCDGHEAGGYGDVIALQALGIAGAVPFFLVRQGNLLGALKERVLGG